MGVSAGLAVLAAVLAAGCGGSPQPAAEERADGSATTRQSAPAAGVDPREDGLEIAMGEWALTVEAQAIRPGPVTFVITNRGAAAHGFEFELEEGGSDRGDRLKAETGLLQPGESVRFEADLPAGLYKLECFVDGHDDLGMEALLEVRADAPLAPEQARGGGNTVAIAGFDYEPETLTVAPGETVTWANEDEAGHTVTHEGDEFGSETLARGEAFRMRFDRPGRYRYLCALHPEMRGMVVVRH